MTDVLDEFLRQEEGWVLVNLWEEWADACRRMNQVMDDLETGAEHQLTILRLNLSDHRAWASSHRVEGTPSLLVFHQGRLVAAVRGVVDLPTLRAWLSQLEHDVGSAEWSVGTDV